MNFYDLFEASKEDEYQDVTMADPKAELALKQARAKYSYANSDLEAFIKMQQDEQEQDERDIDQLETDTERQEELIKKNIEQLQHNQSTIDKLRKTEKQALDTIDKLERENMVQNQELTKLRAAKNDLDAMSAQYSDWASRMKSELETMQSSLAGVETPSGNYTPPSRSIPDAPKRRRAEYVPPDQDTVLSRRLSSDD